MAGKSAQVTMTQGPLTGILLRVAAPIALTNLVQSSYDIVNAFWVGRLGANAIAAVAASGPPSASSSHWVPGWPRQGQS